MSVTRNGQDVRAGAAPVVRRTFVRRRRVRMVAAALAAATSVLYFLIGFQVLNVLDNTAEQTEFGLIAGAAFLAGALVLRFVDQRVLWGLGAVAQALIIFMYFSLGPDRTPSFEFWGIAIRVLQVILLGALVYLAVRPKNQAVRPG